MKMISDVIAERKLVFITHFGNHYDCRLIFGKIIETDLGWCCPYQILGYKTDYISKAYGVDSFQALQAAFELMNVQIEVLSREGKFIEDGQEISSILPRSL